MHINFMIPDFWVGVLAAIVALPALFYGGSLFMLWVSFGGGFRRR
jgi:hypothetical protein